MRVARKKEIKFLLRKNQCGPTTFILTPNVHRPQGSALRGKYCHVPFDHSTNSDLSLTFSGILWHSPTFSPCFLFYFAKSISNHLFQLSRFLLFLLYCACLGAIVSDSIVFHALLILLQCYSLTFCHPYHLVITSISAPTPNWSSTSYSIPLCTI